MHTLKTRLPGLLIALRVLLGPLVFLLARSHHPVLLAAFLVVAFLSDVFDGVLARRFGCVTASLRVADSRADIWYYLWVAAAVCVRRPHVVHALRLPLDALLVLQMLSYLLAWARYGRTASFHAYSAKFWGLTLFLAAVALLTTNHGGLPFLWCAIVMGFVNNIEGIAMTLVLPVWTHDVSGIAHACRLRRRASKPDSCPP